MLKFLSLVIVLSLCVACDQRSEPELSASEQNALEHISRTPYLHVYNVVRCSEHELVVSTRQGDEKIRYLIDSSKPDAEPHDMVHRLASTGHRYSYDRSKPRGTFRDSLR